MRVRFSPTLVPSMPRACRTSSSGSTPVNTRLPIMSGAKRAPSSLVKNAAASGCSVSTPASLSVSMTSSAASTPRLPSKRPPVRTVSMCDPAMTAGPDWRPGRTPTTLPMPSTVESRPSSRIQPQTRSRPALSSSDSARRAQPPPSMAPMAARSARRRCSRPALIFRFEIPEVICCAQFLAALSTAARNSFISASPSAPKLLAICALTAGWASSRNLAISAAVGV